MTTTTPRTGARPGPASRPAGGPSSTAGSTPAGARVLRLGTRRSALATTQSRWVADRIEAAGAAVGAPVHVELVEITTRGDVDSAPLASMGGTGVFVSALREALLAGRVDLAVHSLKDLPTAPAAGLVLAAVPEREDPRDVLVARDGLRLADLGAGARVGTGSPRRAAQLRALGRQLDVVDVRGNVDTRLGFVRDGRLDAVVLARAGLLRLGRAAEATEVFEPGVMLPAPGQGALAVECRAGDPDVESAVALLDHLPTRAAVAAERALLARLEAGCAAPVGGLAVVDRAMLSLEAVVASLEGTVVVRRAVSAGLPVPAPDDPPAAAGSVPDLVSAAAVAIGRDLADRMLSGGAAALLPPPASAAGPAVPAREGDL